MGDISLGPFTIKYSSVHPIIYLHSSYNIIFVNNNKLFLRFVVTITKGREANWRKQKTATSQFRTVNYLFLICFPSVSLSNCFSLPMSTAERKKMEPRNVRPETVVAKHNYCSEGTLDECISRTVRYWAGYWKDVNMKVWRAYMNVGQRKAHLGLPFLAWERMMQFCVTWIISFSHSSYVPDYNKVRLSFQKDDSFFSLWFLEMITTSHIRCHKTSAWKESAHSDVMPSAIESYSTHKICINICKEYLVCGFWIYVLSN